MGFLITKRDGANLMLALADGGAVEVFDNPGAGSGVTNVTATAPVTSTGGLTPNIALTSPSRGYGIGTVDNPIGAAYATIATVTLVPSNTGKLQISPWGAVLNGNAEVPETFQYQLIDGANNVLFTSPQIQAPANATGSFAVTIDSDLNAGGTPETYALGVPVTINLQIKDVHNSGQLSIAAGASGLLVKENVV
jgi:hypothetical protein